MTPRGALSQGFRSIRQRPLLLLIEIAWRWCFGLFMLAAIALSTAVYLRLFPLSPDDLRALHSMAPPLVAAVLAKILIAGGPLLLRIVSVLVPLLLLSWALLASAGRSAVLARLPEFSLRPKFATSVALHFWRAVLFFFAVLAILVIIVGAGFAGVALTHRMEPDLRITSAILFPGLLIVGFLWSVANWYLSAAVLFADARKGMKLALAQSYRFSRRNRRELMQSAIAMSAFRLVLLLAITIVSLLVVVPLAGAPAAFVLVLLLVLTLLYFALSDFLSLARLLAYLFLIKREQDGPPFIPTKT